MAVDCDAMMKYQYIIEIAFLCCLYCSSLILYFESYVLTATAPSRMKLELCT